MAHGNIYPAERVDAALANYFRPGNLTALRELAILETMHARTPQRLPAPFSHFVLGVKARERDVGQRPGLTTDERARLKELERENFELKRANEILRKASAFFAQAELDRRHK